MFSHVVLGSNDLDRSKRFYDAVLGAIGGEPGNAMGQRIIYQHNDAMLVVTRPIDGQAATHANGGTVGFTVDSPEQADAWHAAGVAAGGTAVEDPPGLRGSGRLYLAYLRDPDGNKLCAMKRMA